MFSSGSICNFDMQKHKTPLESPPDWSFFLWPASLLLLTGKARHRWSQGVAAGNHDLHDGVKYPRDARWSIVVRSGIPPTLSIPVPPRLSSHEVPFHVHASLPPI